MRAKSGMEMKSFILFNQCVMLFLNQYKSKHVMLTILANHVIFVKFIDVRNNVSYAALA